MATMQNLVDRARTTRINDPQKIRHPDSKVLQHLNDFVKVVFNYRPDFFIGAFATSPPAELALGGTYPLPPVTEPWAVEYVATMLNLPEDEEAKQMKATDAEKRLMRYLLGAQ